MTSGSSKNKITASVIICCYNKERINWVLEAMNSVIQQSVKPDEVIVVYDDSPGVKNALLNNLPPLVKIIPNKYKRGLSQARNTGFESAISYVMCFLDDDAVANPDWLKNVFEPFSDPFVVGVGGKAAPDWIGSGKRPAWLPEELDWTIGCTHTTFGNDRKKVRNVFGCNMAFRRQ